MNPALIALALATCAGAFMAIQPPTNALLGASLSSPLLAATTSFLVGAAVLVLIAIATQPKIEVSTLTHVPWYAWLGGFYGAFFVAVAAFATPRIGMGAYLSVVIASQVVVALALDHFGTLGLARNPLNAPKAIGAALLILGAFIVRRSS